MIRRILLEEDLQYFYKNPEYIEMQFEQDQYQWNNGNILDPWFKTTSNLNPHHIVPTSRGGNDNWKNKRFMNRLDHNDFHTVFQNLTPREQFIIMLIAHKRALNPEFINDIKLLHREIPEPECYKDGTLNKKKW